MTIIEFTIYGNNNNDYNIILTIAITFKYACTQSHKNKQLERTLLYRWCSIVVLKLRRLLDLSLNNSYINEVKGIVNWLPSNVNLELPRHKHN